MLLPYGHLFKSLDHFKSNFCPGVENDPKGAWLDLFRRLYRVLVMAHSKDLVHLPALTFRP
jgi:hypothetical protein